MTSKEFFREEISQNDFSSKLNNLSVFKKTAVSCYLDENILNKENQNNTLYFGTGLASVNGESLGFGVEFLSTFCTAMWLKKELNLKYVIHEISTEGYNISEESKEKLVKHEEKLVKSIITNLGLEDVYKLKFSRDYHESSDFRDIREYVTKSLSEFESLENFGKISNYTILQLTGMKFLYNKNNTRTKLGWITDINQPPEKIDRGYAENLINLGHLNEFYFDSIYRFVFPNDKYSFLYTPCAIDFKNGGRTVPYSVSSEQSRPILNGRSIKEFMNRVENKKIKDRAINNWSENIVDMFESVFFILPTTDSSQGREGIILDKLDYIQREICGLEIRSI